MSLPAFMRQATVDDAASLSGLAERSFRAAFASANRAADIEAYVREAFSLDRMLEELRSSVNTFVLACDDDGSIVGYANLRAGAPDPQVSDPKAIEIERLYADPESIGRGIGSLLMQSCLEEAAGRGYRTAWLGVWERNPRAIRFYERWHFTVVGSHGFRLGSDEQIDLVMERPVSLPD